MTDEHALRLLEFARIREDAAGYCLSEEGRESLLSELPLADRASVSALKRAVSAVLALFQAGEEPPRLAFPPIGEPARDAAKEGSSLEVEGLYALGLWADSYQAFLRFIAKAAPRAQAGGGAAPPGAKGEAGEDPLEATLRSAPDLARVSRIAFSVLNRDGTLRDLPELRAARERIARTHREIEAIAEGYLRDPETRTMLQSDEPTIRDGRTVLALRANFRGRIRGIVHEVSATGQTVFLEPDELVQKNNELVQEEARYRMELARVLRDAAARLLPEAPAIEAARSATAVLDGLYARARHARVGGLVMARDLEAGFTLRAARHPLLGRGAVPIDVELPEGTRTLIVTGPNTGGKTVTLKTIGLLALMNQFGLAVPAAPETGFAVFDAVHADIGDEQSIDQSLSTFSGHMRVIGSITATAGPRSLVLLDELGSGTDPEEGCAVAMSLLDCFIERGCLTVLTTHHGILKNYGYSRPGCLNASMEFDKASLSPTYRIHMGIPGESRALEVAEKNGLSPAIVSGARKYLAEERADVSELIRGLTERHRRLEDLEAERERRLRDAREEQRRSGLERLRLRQAEMALRERGVGELRRLLAESRKTLENLVRDLREGGVTPERTKAVKEFLGELAAATERESGRLESLEAAGGEAEEPDAETPVGAPRSAPPAIREGSQVLAGTLRKRGVVLRPAKKGHWEVQIGSMRLTLPESELRPAGDGPAADKPQVQVELAPRGEGGAARAVFELDLRGQRLSEALDAVEKQVDAASLQGLSLFSIIHGTGEGVLGRGIQEYLRAHPGVADYHFARPEEGGYGKTVVRLK